MIEGAALRLAVVASHPIQYHAPLYRALASRLDLTVFFAHRASAADQARAGFEVPFEWDTDLLGGYEHVFLENVAADPGVHHFRGCDTPGLYRHLAAGAFDALLVQGWHFKSYLQALAYAKRLGLPVIARGDSQLATPRSLARRLAKKIAYPPFLRLFAAALYVGERSRGYWEHYLYPAHRLYFSPHCVDIDWFAARATEEVRARTRLRLGVPRDRLLLLFAGKLVDFKRPLDLVEAAPLLRAGGLNVGLLVAGAGPMGDEMRARAAASGVPLHDLGFCNQSEMPTAYAAADLLVLPSEKETWGLVANEALACGTPVLLSDAVGSAPDLAADGLAGATFRQGCIPDLAEAAARLLKAPPSKEAIAAKSQAYSIEAAAAGIVRAAEAVATRKRGIRVSGRPRSRPGTAA